MATRSERIKLGIFLTTAVVLFAVAMILLTGSELWEEKNQYVIQFNRSVSGLEPGAPVKQMGVRVGFVDRLRVPPDNAEVVKVWIRVAPGTPITKSTRAFVHMQGITGLKYIELKSKEGVRNATRLEPGSEIPAGTSMLRELSGRATDISLKFESLLNNLLTMTRESNRQTLDSILKESDQTVQEFEKAAKSIRTLSDTTDKFIQDNSKDLSEAIQSVDETSDQVNRTLRRVDEVLVDLQKTIEGARIPETIAGVRETNSMIQDRVRQIDIKTAVDHVNVALETLRQLLDRLSQTIAQNQDSFRVIISNIRTVTENLKQISRTFQEKPYIRLFGGDPPERKLPDK
jgi:phospholipid/cholesterol/gamma-HCH transport system substrate-binding protein